MDSVENDNGKSICFDQPECDGRKLEEEHSIDDYENENDLEKNPTKSVLENEERIVNAEKTENASLNESLSDYLPYRLQRDFYMVDGLELARKLLGKIIVRKTKDNKIITAKIVETEAYMGVDDKACHAYGGRRTARTKYLWRDGGYLYIYTIYRPTNYCVTITCNEDHIIESVLIRAVEPLTGVEHMQKFRKNQTGLLNRNKYLNLCNGPGKVGEALDIDRPFMGEDLTKSDKVFIIDNPTPENIEIKVSKRVNIDYAQEYKDKPWRFYIDNNQYVSKGK